MQYKKKFVVKTVEHHLAFCVNAPSADLKNDLVDRHHMCYTRQYSNSIN